MRIGYVTSGAGGMFCGSCMRDNTLVTALRELGHDAVLVPTYTPIRTDEPDVSPAELIKFYRDMLLIRRFEEKAGQMYGMG